MMYDGEYSEYTQGKEKPIQKIIKLFLKKGWDINGIVNDSLQTPITAASDKAHWKEPVKKLYGKS
ncbi:MAG: hypothetical protein LIO65_05995 [Odoribacter sp.]|nr:hypothetical protein [Odoribacter sp.]